MDFLAPVIRLSPLTSEEMLVLVEKLSKIHGDLFGYEKILTEEDLIEFIKIEFSRIGADINITPREVIRDFIEILNITFQNPKTHIKDLLGSDEFEFSKNELEDEAVEKTYEEFEI